MMRPLRAGMQPPVKSVQSKCNRQDSAGNRGRNREGGFEEQPQDHENDRNDDHCFLLFPTF